MKVNKFSTNQINHFFLGLVISVFLSFGVIIVISTTIASSGYLFESWIAVAVTYFIPLIIAIVTSTFLGKKTAVKYGLIIGTAIFALYCIGTILFSYFSMLLKVDHLQRARQNLDPQECLKVNQTDVSPAQCVIMLARDNDRPAFCQYYTDSTMTKDNAVNYCMKYVTDFNLSIKQK